MKGLYILLKPKRLMTSLLSIKIYWDQNFNFNVKNKNINIYEQYNKLAALQNVILFFQVQMYGSENAITIKQWWWLSRRPV